MRRRITKFFWTYGLVGFSREVWRATVCLLVGHNTNGVGYWHVREGVWCPAHNCNVDNHATACSRCGGYTTVFFKNPKEKWSGRVR